MTLWLIFYRPCNTKSNSYMRYPVDGFSTPDAAHIWIESARDLIPGTPIVVRIDPETKPPACPNCARLEKENAELKRRVGKAVEWVKKTDHLRIHQCLEKSYPCICGLGALQEKLKD